MKIGIVGKPNVGKSTFFKALTLANVEIANYPFTTINPNIGIGYIRKKCPCSELNVTCNPRNSLCIRKNRFIPVEVIDVAGLVPDAHLGKGLGNQFLNDLSNANCLLHIIDISGTTDEKGEETKDHDPESDIKFLEREINLWFYNIVKRNYDKISKKIAYEKKDIAKELAHILSGLQITESQIRKALGDNNLDNDEKIKEFSFKLREISKPIILVANKIDKDKNKNFERLKDKYNIIPCFAEAEVALKTALKNKIIDYIPGDSEFKILKDINENQKKALDFLQNFLKEYKSTGVQIAINKAVEILNYIAVYPVEDENKFSDSKGNVLPDCFLMPYGSTPVDLAFKIHTEIGKKFITAIDCKKRINIRKDYILNDGDVIKIVAGR